MPSIFRDAVVTVFLDEEKHELARLTLGAMVPRVGENVRLGKTPYIVERIGYDIPEKDIESIWIVLRPA